MNLPISWLTQFVSLEKTPEEIAEKLTLSGSEVERIRTNDNGLSKIIVGEIKKILPHPNADKLQLAHVFIGKKDLLKIVCGAPNIEPGQKVPVVLVGGSVPGMNIEARKVRGETSHGMLASERELGIGDDHTGIVILPNIAEVGTDVIELLALNEPVLELDITPNRPDCFSIIGLARESAALYNRALKIKKHSLQEATERSSASVSVTVQQKALCPKYCARVVKNVRVGRSPLWLENRLRQVGMRPINAIADITNYVLIERGQPMHAFDLKKISGAQIVVRNAKQGEQLAALDGKTYTLDEQHLIIADKEKPIAIAGVMGGEHSRVQYDTKDIVLEAAVFDPVSVRKTSKQLALRSESSSRFEKGIDYNAVEDAIDYAASLIQEIAGGAAQRGSICSAARRARARTIRIETSEIGKLLGVTVTPKKVKSILGSLGFVVKGGPKEYHAAVPSWRLHDVFVSADLIEEIGRMLDYNTFKKTLPHAPLQSPTHSPLYILRNRLQSHFITHGYTELISYSFYGKKEVALSQKNASEHMVLTNPVNKEYPYLRTSLAPWMYTKLSQNSSLLTRDRFALFEIGNVFDRRGNEEWQAVCGLIDIRATDEQLYRELRGVAESFIGESVDIKKEGSHFVLHLNTATIGHMSISRRNDMPMLRLRSSVALLSLDIAALGSVITEKRGSYTPLPFYPMIERDLAMVLPSDVQYTEIQSNLISFDPLIKDVCLFDVYHGLRSGVSMAFRITFYSTDRTLASKEVDAIIERLKKHTSQKFKATHR